SKGVSIIDFEIGTDTILLGQNFWNFDSGDPLSDYVWVGTDADGNAVITIDINGSDGSAFSLPNFTLLGIDQATAASSLSSIIQISDQNFTTGNDTLTGTAGSDILAGGQGQDSITGQDDDDTIFGGDGADYLFGDG